MGLLGVTAVFVSLTCTGCTTATLCSLRSRLIVASSSRGSTTLQLDDGRGAISRGRFMTLEAGVSDRVLRLLVRFRVDEGDVVDDRWAIKQDVMGQDGIWQ